MVGVTEIRPMTVDDLPGMLTSAEAAFLDLRQRLATSGVPSTPNPPPPSQSRRESGEAIVRQLLHLDPAGAWVAVIGDSVVGVALAGLREGLWYLAQLHLDPAYQGRGIGRRLLAAALDYGRPARGMLLHSSLDPRAMRCYQRAGFALEPALRAEGRLRRGAVPAVADVRLGTPADLDLAADLDRAQRGAAHGPDLELLLRLGATLFVLDRGRHRGYALVHDEPTIVVASDLAAAEAVLWTALAESPGDHVGIHVLRGDQQWAIDVAVRAGLDLRPVGPLCRRGETGRLAPYLPHNAVL
jgi:GNAT superfamily N-acetyltransferase